MLAKCAEAQAIRKGWPEDLSNTFVGEEIEQAALILNPAQAAAEGVTRERLERIGGKDVLIIDWLDAAPLDAVPLGQLADRIVAFLRRARREDPQALIAWRERNGTPCGNSARAPPPMPSVSSRRMGPTAVRARRSLRMRQSCWVSSNSNSPSLSARKRKNTMDPSHVISCLPGCRQERLRAPLSRCMLPRIGDPGKFS